MLTPTRLCPLLLFLLAGCADPQGGATHTGDAEDGDTAPDNGTPDANPPQDTGADTPDDIDAAPEPGDVPDTGDLDALDAPEISDADDPDAEDLADPDIADTPDAEDASDATDEDVAAADATDAEDATDATPDVPDVTPDIEEDTGPNRAPLAEAGDDLILRNGPDWLDGRASTDPDGDALHYRWESQAALGDEDRARPSVGRSRHGGPNIGGRAEVSLTVWDDDGEESTDTMHVYVGTSGQLERTFEAREISEVSTVIRVGDEFYGGGSQGQFRYAVRDGQLELIEHFSEFAGAPVAAGQGHVWVKSGIWMHAVSIETGEEVWRYDRRNPGDPAVAGSLLLIPPGRTPWLAVLDITDPSAPIELATVPPGDANRRVNGIAVHGDHAAMLVCLNLEDCLVHVLDLSDPAQPEEIGTAPVGTYGHLSVVDGRFIVSGPAQTTLVAVRDGAVLPPAPVTVGGRPLPGWRATADDGTLIVVGRDNGVHLFDLTGPTQTRFRGSLPGPVCEIGTVHAFEDGMLFQCGRTFYSLTTPDDSVVEVGSYAGAHFIDANDTTAWVADAAGLDVRDLTQPDLPSRGNWTADRADIANRAIRHGETIYYWEAGTRLTVLDTADPGDIQVVAQSTSPRLGGLRPLAASSRLLAVADETTVWLFDAQTLEARGSITPQFEPVAVGIWDEFIYVAHGSREEPYLTMAHGAAPFAPIAQSDNRLAEQERDNEYTLVRIGRELWVSGGYYTDCVQFGTVDVGVYYQRPGPFVRDEQRDRLAGGGKLFDAADTRNLPEQASLTPADTTAPHSFGGGRLLALTQQRTRLAAWRPPEYTLEGGDDAPQPGDTVTWAVEPVPAAGQLVCEVTAGTCEIEGNEIRWTTTDEGWHEAQVSLIAPRWQVSVGRRFVEVRP